MTTTNTIRTHRHRPLSNRVLAAVAAAVITSLATSGTAVADPKPVPDPLTYLSPLVLAKMAAQQPLVAAASRIQWAVERGASKGYAGVGLGNNEVVVWWKGDLPAAVGNTVAEIRRTTPVRISAAANSRAELEAAAKGIADYLRANPRSPYYGVDIAYDGSGLVVNTDPGRIRPAALPAEMKVPVGIAVSVAEKERPRLTGRLDDFAPYWGGGRIKNQDNGAGCTAGFPVTAGNGARYMLTAGHCGRPGGGWNNGNDTLFFGTGAYENVEHDLLLISANVAGRIWDGGVGSGEFTKGVARWDWVFAGEWLCTSGSVTGALCGHVVSNNFTHAFCGTDVYGFVECYNDLILASQRDGLTASRRGDSGGPVFGLVGTGQVTAKGTITGVSGTSGLIFQD
ncbi:MAG TPA: hypothetical protein VFC19_54005, partial [Candidatus Limnocylindrales bacterium]|nr:hypothetical protein [Candidatus Limnocylindrales bacterium]